MQIFNVGYHGNQTIHVAVVFKVNFPLSKEVLKKKYTFQMNKHNFT